MSKKRKQSQREEEEVMPPSMRLNSTNPQNNGGVQENTNGLDLFSQGGKRRRLEGSANGFERVEQLHEG